MHGADRIIDAVLRHGTPLCLGLDPRWELLPEEVRQRYGQTEWGRARAYEEFCCRCLDIAQGHLGIVKVQSAFFEALGPEGMTVLRYIIQGARRRGFFVILDAKRGDIPSTGEAYAEAVYRIYGADAVTVSPLFGRESLVPFVTMMERRGGALFVLVRTSNIGARDYQDLECGGRKLCECIAEDVEQWARQTRGMSGFGAVGAVVGAVEAEMLVRLRALMPTALFLIPGYGAQGGRAELLRGAFVEPGKGAIVNAARSILYAAPAGERCWEIYVEKALLAAKRELALAAGLE
ncbi:MAG: orotidine-5'-phosphate decarboxylase [Gemmatales bacterium]|nr:orotidine-5'-phosphate decarboxylase [Gemmatales bacterium]MDW7995948.1 orotidine-5'-phosphate decarboxylase [Gemmatales bacterium]